MSEQLEPALKDFLVQWGSKMIQVAANTSYRAKVEAQFHWRLKSTCNMDVFKCTPAGKATGEIILEGE